MPSTDCGTEVAYVEFVALLAQLLDAGKKIDWKQLEEVAGERCARVYRQRLRTVLRHAMLVNEDRKKGGKGRLSELVPADELRALLCPLSSTSLLVIDTYLRTHSQAQDHPCYFEETQDCRCNKPGKEDQGRGGRCRFGCRC